MQCCALTLDKKRCANFARDASYFCDAHQNEMARISDTAPRRRGIFSRWRSVSTDGGKFDVPKWLNDLPTPRVMEHLQTHPDSIVRWMSAYVLRKRRAPEAIHALWHVLKQDPARVVRQQCAVALGKIGTPLVFAPLVEALNHDRDQSVRQACAIALGNLGLPGNLGMDATEEVARVLEQEENIFVKWDCIVALGQLGDPSAGSGQIARVEKLLIRLQAEEIAQVIRDACHDSLQEIRSRNRMMAM